MKLHRRAALCACAFSFAMSPAAQSTVINAYFGMNFVGGTIPGGPLGGFELNLVDITYVGEGGVTHVLDMPDFGGTFIESAGTAPRTGLPDYAGLTPSPTYTTQPVVGGVPVGDGETTRTINQTLAIDWDTTGGFPTIDITSITVDTFVFGGPWVLEFTTPYTVGLIPAGTINELDSLLFTPFGDIYDGLVGVAGNPIGAAVVTTAPPGFDGSGLVGEAFGEFTFAAAQPVPVPAAIWLFGSGLLGFAGIARSKQSV